MTHMQRNEPSKAPISERRSSKMGIDSAMMNDMRQLKATQELTTVSAANYG